LDHTVRQKCDPNHRAFGGRAGAVLAVFHIENALMIFGVSSEIFCKLLPGFPVEGCED